MSYSNTKMYFNGKWRPSNSCVYRKLKLGASPASNHTCSFPLCDATSLEISRSTNGKNLGLRNGDFEPVQHRLDAWESRANGGFGGLLRWRATS
jgi:hypothetical protein